MTATLTAIDGGAKARHGAASPNGRRTWVDPVAVALAKELCCTVSYAQKRMREAGPVAATVVRIMETLGFKERADNYREGIDRAGECRVAPPDCEGTWSLADYADTNEDRRQGEYERARRVYAQSPTEPNRAAYWKARRNYIEACREERTKLTGIIDLLVREVETEEGRA